MPRKQQRNIVIREKDSEYELVTEKQKLKK